MSIIYEKLLSENNFFKNKPVEFIGLIAPKLKFYKLEAEEVIYRINDVANEMFFVVKGEVRLSVQLTSGEIAPYKIRVTGKHFGEIDMILDPN